MSALSDAIAAIKAGERVKGREMLSKVLLVEPNNVTALFWMTEVVDIATDKRKLLLRVLAIDPNNAIAGKALKTLESRQESIVSQSQELPMRESVPQPTRPVGEPMVAAVVEKTKKCPYCAEIIKSEAVVCRYCGHSLDKAPSARLPKQEPLPHEMANEASLSRSPRNSARRPLLFFVIGIFVLAFAVFATVVYDASQRLGAVSLPVNTPSPTRTPLPKPSSTPKVTPTRDTCEDFQFWFDQTNPQLSRLKSLMEKMTEIQKHFGPNELRGQVKPLREAGLEFASIADVQNRTNAPQSVATINEDLVQGFLLASESVQEMATAIENFQTVDENSLAQIQEKWNRSSALINPALEAISKLSFKCN